MQSYHGGGPIVPSTTGRFLGLGASVDACISYHLVVECLIDIFIDRLLHLQLPLLLVYRCASARTQGPSIGLRLVVGAVVSIFSNRLVDYLLVVCVL